jgi:hypothetical protein
VGSTAIWRIPFLCVFFAPVPPCFSVPVCCAETLTLSPTLNFPSVSVPTNGLKSLLQYVTASKRTWFPDTVRHRSEPDRKLPAAGGMVGKERDGVEVSLLAKEGEGGGREEMKERRERREIRQGGSLHQAVSKRVTPQLASSTLLRLGNPAAAGPHTLLSKVDAVRGCL